MDDLAASLHVSSSTLAHKFKQQTGAALMQFVRRCRIKTSAKLLQQGLSVVQTSERMGFANPYHFSRLFKQLTGQAPSALRKKPVRSLLHPPTMDR